MGTQELAALAALLSAIATGFAAWAAIRGPMKAAREAEGLRATSARNDELRRMKMWVFTTLMQERANFLTTQAVQAFNAIDIVFLTDVKVRESWADLYHYFNSGGALDSQVINEKSRDLLRQMGIVLGLSDQLKRDDFSRVYYPRAKAEADYVERLQHDVTRQQLEAALADLSANSTPTTAPTHTD